MWARELIHTGQSVNWCFAFGQVCGLKWSPDHQHLASGGNDNKLFVWNTRSVGPVQTYAEHLAAVKAIAWSPHQHGLLASGGGTADRRIRFWNTITGRPLQCVDTGSQVCNLAWSKHSSELVSHCVVRLWSLSARTVSLLMLEIDMLQNMFSFRPLLNFS